MRKTHWKWLIYVISTGVLPILLFYPAMIYRDLAGMGGYDGFASISMMERHGAWSVNESSTGIYHIFEGLSLLWLLSLINLPVGGGIALALILKKYWGLGRRSRE